MPTLEAGSSGQVRTYRSKSGSIFKEPTSLEDTFGHWVKAVNGNERIHLKQARYVHPDVARQVVSKYGRGQAAIDHVFDLSNTKMDYYAPGGIILYNIAGKERLEASQEIIDIFPPLSKRVSASLIEETLNGNSEEKD